MSMSEPPARSYSQRMSLRGIEPLGVVMRAEVRRTSPYFPLSSWSLSQCAAGYP